MKKNRITIKAEDLKIRNWMHFHVQLKNRVMIVDDKKKYYRPRYKQLTKQILKECY